VKKEIVVFTSGSWDLFHVGHLNVLKRSKALGDRLIVGVSTDELIEDYKGVAPTIPFEQRMQIVEAIDCVDMVVKQTILTEIAQLEQFNVDVVAIGDDWKDRYLEGLEWMKGHGRVVYLPYTKDVSTTSIKRKIIDNIYSVISAELRRELERPEEWKRRQMKDRQLSGEVEQGA
jgi:glycerol-3-phosphate cytidylyltransferase